jgi:predicted ArsR family transcriptional regulator
MGKEKDSRGRDRQFRNEVLLRKIDEHPDPFLTAPELAEMVTVSKTTVNNRLHELKEEGKVVRKEAGRTAVWWLPDRMGVDEEQPDSEPQAATLNREDIVSDGGYAANSEQAEEIIGSLVELRQLQNKLDNHVEGIETELVSYISQNDFEEVAKNVARETAQAEARQTAEHTAAETARDVATNEARETAVQGLRKEWFPHAKRFAASSFLMAAGVVASLVNAAAPFPPAITFLFGTVLIAGVVASVISFYHLYRDVANNKELSSPTDPNLSE